MSDVTYPVDIEAPDISPYRKGNTGIDYVTTLESGASGPHVMLSAVVHGNELCGAIALDYLMQNEVRPVAGKLTLAFMNVAAFDTFDETNPTVSRYVDEDFNRLWTREVLDGDRDSVELRRAREVWPIVDQADFLLDIHSMQHSTVPLMMCGPVEKGRQLARDLTSPEHVVSDAGHAAGRRMRDYEGFSDPVSPRNALLGVRPALGSGQRRRGEGDRAALPRPLRGSSTGIHRGTPERGASSGTARHRGDGPDHDRGAHGSAYALRQMRAHHAVAAPA
jgi:predicted deacylase